MIIHNYDNYHAILYKRENGNIIPFFILPEFICMKNGTENAENANLNGGGVDLDVKKISSVLDIKDANLAENTNKKGFKYKHYIFNFKKKNLAGHYITTVKINDNCNKLHTLKFLLLDITENDIEYVENYCYASNLFIKCLKPAYLIKFKDFYALKFLTGGVTELKPDYFKIKLFKALNVTLDPCTRLQTLKHYSAKHFDYPLEILKLIKGLSINALNAAIKDFKIA